MSKSVLLFDGGGTQTLPIAKSLSKDKYNVHAFYNKKWTYGYGTKYIHNKVLIPSSVYSEDNYLEFMIDYLERNKIDIIIPLGDVSANFLSKNKDRLASYSNFIIPDYEIFKKGYDKNELMRICEINNFPHPRTIDLTSKSIDSIDESIFPAMLKPNYTTGGRGMVKVNNRDELMQVYKEIKSVYGNCHLQEFISPGGKQIKVQLFVNDKSELLYSSVIYKQRYYPISGGSSCCNITIDDSNLVAICYDVLRAIKWIGFADFDLIEDPKDSKLKIMEINPRIPACIKSAIESGIDYGIIIAEYSLEKRTRTYNYSSGKSLRHFGFDFLWFLSSPNRFNSSPNWFNFFKKGLSFQDISLSDPLPFFYGTIGNFINVLNPAFRKSKSI